MLARNVLGGEDRVVRVNLLVGVVKFPPEGSFLYR